MAENPSRIRRCAFSALSAPPVTAASPARSTCGGYGGLQSLERWLPVNGNAIMPRRPGRLLLTCTATTSFRRNHRTPCTPPRGLHCTSDQPHQQTAIVSHSPIWECAYPLWSRLEARSCRRRWSPSRRALLAAWSNGRDDRRPGASFIVHNPRACALTTARGKSEGNRRALRSDSVERLNRATARRRPKAAAAPARERPRAVRLRSSRSPS